MRRVSGRIELPFSLDLVLFFSRPPKDPRFVEIVNFLAEWPDRPPIPLFVHRIFAFGDFHAVRLPACRRSVAGTLWKEFFGSARTRGLCETCGGRNKQSQHQKKCTKAGGCFALKSTHIIILRYVAPGQSW